MGVKFTSVVRRGIRQILDRGLGRHVELTITNCTAAHLHRSQRLTKAEVAELRAAIQWMEENAAPSPAEDGPEAVEGDAAALTGEPGPLCADGEAPSLTGQPGPLVPP